MFIENSGQDWMTAAPPTHVGRMKNQIPEKNFFITLYWNYTNLFVLTKSANTVFQHFFQAFLLTKFAFGNYQNHVDLICGDLCEVDRIIEVKKCPDT